MATSRKLLCAVYALISIGALIATWSQNLAYTGDSANLSTFWTDTKVDPASRSITVDIVLLSLAAVIFMVIEARKHRIKFVWAYIIGGLLIAISVTFPLFLIARELRMADPDADNLRPIDIALLVLVGIGSAAFVLWVDVF